MRAATGRAGRDRRGLWVNDPAAGLRLRVGEVGQELAYSLAEQGNIRAAREALSKPHVGMWFSKTF